MIPTQQRIAIRLPDLAVRAWMNFFHPCRGESETPCFAFWLASVGEAVPSDEASTSASSKRCASIDKICSQYTFRQIDYDLQSRRKY